MNKREYETVKVEIVEQLEDIVTASNHVDLPTMIF
jgi:hypothetical protein